MRMNPYCYNAPPHWNDIKTAPRDGTPIEIQNNWGVAPWYAICRWNDDTRWQIINQLDSGMVDGPHLSWRPYTGNVSDYVDPSGGAQNTSNYWLMACGMPPLPGGDLTFKEEAQLKQQKINMSVVAQIDIGKKPSWWKRLLNGI